MATTDKTKHTPRTDCPCNQGPIVHQGLHRYRFTDNPEEARFAEAWEKIAQGNLDWLLHVGSQGPGGPQPISPRDASVAATVAQFLGSLTGQAFLRDLGYYRFDAAVREKLLAMGWPGLEMEPVLGVPVRRVSADRWQIGTATCVLDVAVDLVIGKAVRR